MIWPLISSTYYGICLVSSLKLVAFVPAGAGSKRLGNLGSCFRFENGLPDSGSWCYVAHESAHGLIAEIIGTEGQVSFSVFDYKPIRKTMATDESIIVPNPPYVQYPLIKNVIRHLQGLAICTCTSR